MTLEQILPDIDTYANRLQENHHVSNPDFSIYLASIGYQHALAMTQGIPADDAQNAIRSTMSTLAELSQMTSNPTAFLKLYDQSNPGAGYNTLTQYKLQEKLRKMVSSRVTATAPVLRITPQTLVHILYDAPVKMLAPSDGDNHRPPHIVEKMDSIDFDPSSELADLQLTSSQESQGYSNDYAA